MRELLLAYMCPDEDCDFKCEGQFFQGFLIIAKQCVLE